ncbi:Cytoplasmic protein, partial [Monkeypox virus]
RPRT